ncbi:MAG: hypothetical protein HWD59_15295 [Coxiellaceae bacterium]|nr:MAG: hypothetical protein HWD59_15295 [Coxiellaceae bacterium]
MARVNLEKYYKGLFKDEIYQKEKFIEINRAHVISSKYYDVQFGRDSILYRDKFNNLRIPIEHDITHKVIICWSFFIENNPGYNIPSDILKTRIAAAFDF